MLRVFKTFERFNGINSYMGYIYTSYICVDTFIVYHAQ